MKPAILTLLASALLVGCALPTVRTEDSAEDYDTFRSAYTEAMEERFAVPSGGTAVTDATPSDQAFAVTDDEIDCIAERSNNSVHALAEAAANDNNRLNNRDELSTIMLRCLRAESLRTLFTLALDKEAADNPALAFLDQDCVIDEVVEVIEEWQQTDASLDELDTPRIGAAAVASCTGG